MMPYIENGSDKDRKSVLNWIKRRNNTIKSILTYSSFLDKSWERNRSKRFRINNQRDGKYWS